MLLCICTNYFAVCVVYAESQCINMLFLTYQVPLEEYIVIVCQYMSK